MLLKNASDWIVTPISKDYNAKYHLQCKFLKIYIVFSINTLVCIK